MTNFESAEERALQRSLVEAFVESAVRDGSIQVAGRTDAEIAADVYAHLRSITDQASAGELAFVFQIDHGAALRNEAQRLADSGNEWLAVTLYAVAVEHMLNGMIRAGAERMGLSAREATDAIRDVGMRAKTGWLWQLLFDETFPSDMRVRIQKLADLRNGFVHYKWVGEIADDPENDARDRQMKSVCADAPSLLDALGELDDDLLFSGRRSDLGRIVSGSDSGAEGG